MLTLRRAGVDAVSPAAPRGANPISEQPENAHAISQHLRGLDERAQERAEKELTTAAESLSPSTREDLLRR